MLVGRGGGGHDKVILHPHASNPTNTTHSYFVLSPVSLASRDQDGGLSNHSSGELDDRRLRSRGKTGA